MFSIVIWNSVMSTLLLRARSFFSTFMKLRRWVYVVFVSRKDRFQIGTVCPWEENIGSMFLMYLCSKSICWTEANKEFQYCMPLKFLCFETRGFSGCMLAKFPVMITIDQRNKQSLKLEITWKLNSEGGVGKYMLGYCLKFTWVTFTVRPYWFIS